MDTSDSGGRPLLAAETCRVDPLLSRGAKTFSSEVYGAGGPWLVRNHGKSRKEKSSMAL